MQTFRKTVLRAFMILLVFTVLCGLLYPLLVTGISQLFFKDKANGSLIEVGGKQYGSALLAQQFTGEEYLWGRVMNLNTRAFRDENGTPLLYAGPSNKSPAGEEYEALVKERVEKLRAAHPDQKDEPIPADLVTCSGSGLDPHISPDAAEYQVGRVAKKRGLSPDAVREVIARYTTGRTFGVFGEPVVNVLEVNLALDGVLK